MSSEVLKLFKAREKLLNDMLDCIKKASFTYTEDDIDKFGIFVDNLSVHVKVLEKNMSEIKNYRKSLYSADTEVCEAEKRCKAITKEIYDLDKEINDKMKLVLKDIKSKFFSAKNQQKFYNYSSNVDYISESFASFDAKQ